MNPKVAKLKAEREKNCEKITALQARNNKIDVSITEIENTDIIGMVRDFELSPDQLMELLRAMKKTPMPNISERTEDETLEE